MYIPKQFKLEDRETIIGFIKQYNFAPIITIGNGRPHATHLPFHIDDTNGVIRLTAHMAKANPQWKDFDAQEALIIFSGPHAYISPTNYEKHENVPTWNYLAVHVYAKVHLVHDEARGYEILHEMMQQSEPAFLRQWSELDEGYKQRLFKGIVAFEIEVTDIQAKHKMSQNKTATERQNIIGSLSKEDDTAMKETAKYMEQNEGKF